MKHFFSTKVKAVLIIAVLLSAGLAITSSLLGKSIPDLLVQGVLTPLRSGVSSLTLQAERLYDYIYRYESLEAENTQLKQQVSDLEDAARQADSISRENDRLRKLLELQKAHEDFVLVDAYIIARSSNDWTSTLTVNRGSTSGLEVNMCAITEDGAVVGLVSEVGSNYAVIKSILDSSLDISATISSTGNSGMVQGGYASGHDGKLEMKYLPSSAVIRTNDQVVTAGSTVYPRNLILGKIVGAGFTDTGVEKYALLEPAADIGSLEQIFIVTQYEVG